VIPAASAKASGPLLRVATWNIHRWTGVDGRRDPARTAEVIRELKIDLIALQEVDPPHRGSPITEWLETETGYEAVAGPTLEDANGEYGNVLLTRLPLLAARRHKLSLSLEDRWEPRGAVDVDLRWSAGPLRVIATHLGLRRRERSRQFSLLRSILRQGPRAADLVLGDTNEWTPLRKSLRELAGSYRWAPLRRTFPSRRALLPLDRALLSTRWRICATEVVRRGHARVASDHLPLKLVLSVE
jgi:endonuclease/exonuclease/phosphatase family metal-dependent hydrolase